MILSSLFISGSPGRGRGVFTTEAILKGSLIESSPVIVLDERERTLLDQTLLHDYIFVWGEDERRCCVALGYLSLYNHDYEANCEYEMEFENGIIRILTMRDIKQGEELCINYNGNWNDAKKVWFDQR
ncbi:MAG TPA: SET domain-containing protein [Puia sp.]|jgi:SET domain-containing protein|nr:SET domain-containing protein [Puia sp.]